MLKRGSSRATISSNIARELRANRPLSQAAAIAFHEARKTARPISTSFGKGCHVKLYRLGNKYEVELKCTGRPARHHAFDSLEAARRRYHALVKEYL